MYARAGCARLGSGRAGGRRSGADTCGRGLALAPVFVDYYCYHLLYVNRRQERLAKLRAWIRDQQVARQTRTWWDGLGGWLADELTASSVGWSVYEASARRTRKRRCCNGSSGAKALSCADGVPRSTSPSLLCSAASAAALLARHAFWCPGPPRALPCADHVDDPGCACVRAGLSRHQGGFRGSRRD